MKKRLLSLLMAMCLMATMVPAAFAADEENGRPIPDELPIVYEEDAVALASDEMTADYPGSGTKADPYVRIIDSPEDFQLLADDCKTYTGTYYDVLVTEDLNLQDDAITQPEKEWTAYLNFFMGSFKANDGVTISGIPENCYLFYQIHNAEIGNFTLDLGGKAGTLMYYTFRIGMADGSVEWGKDRLYDIDVVSDKTVQLKGNAQANYAPFLFASGPYFTMEGCNNYANINGDTYASAFYGYYPLPANGYPTEDNYINFVNCSNHGDITLRYAGLVFGNPTGLRENRHINFTGMKNYGEIRGIQTRHFFSSDAGANDYFVGNSYFVQKDNELMNSEKENFMYETCDGTVCHRGTEHKGDLLYGDKIEGLGVTLYTDQNTGKSYYQVIDPNAAETDYRYVVNAYCYVSLFLIQVDEESKEEILVPDGTTRITMSEEVTEENDYITSKVQNAKLHNDENMPARCQTVDEDQCLYLYEAKGENYGYWLNSKDTYHDTHRVYLNRDKEPGSMDWSVYVSVFDGDKLVDTAVLNRQEVAK